MAPKKSDPEQYSNPELRDRIKAEITAGDKGGKPGEWSARKAQLVAREYEKQGGGYKHPRTEAQQDLKKWGDEHWTTSDGKPAERDSGTTRYLPEAAWDELSDNEKAATNRQKEQGSREGKQFVSNTPKAAEARRRASVDKKQSGKKAVARKKPPTRSGVRAAAKAEAKRSSDAARKAAKPASKKPAVKSTAEADRKAAQKKKAIAASRKAAAQTRKRAAERASRKSG